MIVKTIIDWLNNSLNNTLNGSIRKGDERQQQFENVNELFSWEYINKPYYQNCCDSKFIGTSFLLHVCRHNDSFIRYSTYK